MIDEQSSEEIIAGTGEATDPERVQIRLKTARALSSGDFGDVLVLSYESAREAFTPKRREIIEILSSEEISSVRDLADRLDRNPGNISRELALLAKHNIIDYLEEGTTKRPVLAHETIITEPIVVSGLKSQSEDEQSADSDDLPDRS